MKNIYEVKTKEELKVISDPFRMSIIKTFLKSDKSMTLKDVADILGVAPSKVHYHAKKIIAYDMLILDYTKEINGIIAKYYKSAYDSYQISYDELDENIDDKFISSTEEMVHKVIGEFSNTFVNRIKDKYEVAEKSKKEGKEIDIDIKGSLVNDSLFLTEDDYKVVLNEISAIFDRYNKRTEEKDKLEYAFLLGSISLE
jgi:DNA-binding transcriptional regulator GbsR (MarR family)